MVVFYHSNSKVTKLIYTSSLFDFPVVPWPTLLLTLSSLNRVLPLRGLSFLACEWVRKCLLRFLSDSWSKRKAGETCWSRNIVGGTQSGIPFTRQDVPAAATLVSQNCIYPGLQPKPFPWEHEASRSVVLNLWGTTPLMVKRPFQSGPLRLSETWMFTLWLIKVEKL